MRRTARIKLGSSPDPPDLTSGSVRVSLGRLLLYMHRCLGLSRAVGVIAVLVLDSCGSGCTGYHFILKVPEIILLWND